MKPVDLDELERIAKGIGSSDLWAFHETIRAAISEIREHRANARDLAQLREDHRLVRETIEYLKRSTTAARWTRERPTRPGWYWAKGVVPLIGPGGPTVIQAHRHKSSGEILLSGVGYLEDLEFCGPIPEPVE